MKKPKNLLKLSKKIGEYLDKIIIGILFLMILIIPLIFDPHITSFDLAKVTAMRILTLIIIGIWLLKLTFLNEYQFIKTPLDLPIFAFLIISIAATINGVHPFISLVGEYKRYDGLISTFNYILIYYIAVNFLGQREYLKRTMVFITVAGVLSAGCGILQSYKIDLTRWESGGIISTFGNPNFLGGYLAMSFFLPLSLFFLMPKKKKKPDRQKLFLSGIIISIILIYWCLYLTNHRGGILGLGGGLILVGILLCRQFLKKLRLKFLLLFGIMGVVTTFLLFKAPNSPLQKFASIVKVEKKEGDADSTLKFVGTAETRIYIWRTGLHIIKDYPILGVGPDALRMVSTQYENIEFIRTEGGKNCLIDKAHNEILDMAITRGLLGLAAYFWIIIALFIFIYKTYPKILEENRILLVGVLAAVISYLVQNQVGFGVIGTSSLFWLLLGMAILPGMPKPQKTKLIKLPIIIRIVICIPLLILIYHLISLSLRPYIADIYYKNGLAMVYYGNIDQAIASYEKALEYNREEFYYGEVLNAYNIKFNQTQDMSWLDRLIAKCEEAVKCNPLHPYYYNLLSSSYGEKYVRGDESYAHKSIEASKNALKYKPLFADPYNNIAAIYVRQGKYDEAIKEMEQASALFPDDTNYLRILGELYQVTGQINKAIELLKKAIEYNPEKSDLYSKLGKIYFDQKRYKEAEVQFKKAIELDSNNIFARNNLGTIYINQQRFKEARDEFEAVLKVEVQNDYAKQMLAIIVRE